MLCHISGLVNTLSTVTTAIRLKFENIANFKNWIVSYTLGRFILAPLNFIKFHRNKFSTCFILHNLCKFCTNSSMLYNKLAKNLF